MNLTGIIVGVCSFLTIGLFHPIVVKAEYYWGVGCWWLFAIVGVGCCVGSLLIEQFIASTVLAVVGFACFWSILELFQQRKRVARGWFPANPKRQQKQEKH